MDYSCLGCKYNTTKLKDWKKHLATKKHANNLIKEPSSLPCSFCDRVFGSRTTLWRHKKTCSPNKITVIDCSGNINTRLLNAINENTMVNKELLNERKQNEGCHNIIIGNNNIVNINMFLNSECSNAMSIQNFIRGMTITIEDLCNNKSDALTNIVIRNLQPLSIKERPVHYKDKSEWYIKDELVGWNEDNGERLLDAAAFGIQRNWQKEFELKYPLWMENDKLKDMYVALAETSSSDIQNSERESILKIISKKVMFENIM